MTDPILTGYAVAFILYALTLLSCLIRWNALSGVLSLTALAVNGLILTGISMKSGQPPVFEIFGGLLFVTFVLGILGVFGCRVEDGRLNVKSWVWMEILLIFGITLFFAKEPPPHRYHHTYIWVVLFHGFRCLALSLALFSSAYFIRFKIESVRKRVNNPLFKQGRNFLLLSAVAFLCVEYSGIIWCQNGRGDFWHWSPAFFQSTLIILCLMAAFHIPGKNPRSDDLRSIIAIMPPLLMLTKGNSSVLYGANTMKTNLYLGSRMDKFYMILNGGFLDSEGYRVSKDLTPGPNQGHGTRNNSDILQKNVEFKAGFTPMEGHEYAICINYVDSEWGLHPESPYKTFGYPVTPVLFILFNLWINFFCIKGNPLVSLYGAGTIACGILLFY